MDSVDTFIGITGAPRAVAIRMLQENRGELNAAVNAFFGESDTPVPPSQPEEPERVDYMDEDEPVIPAAQPRGLGLPPWEVPLPRPTFDPLGSLFGGRGIVPDIVPPFVSHPRDVRNVPIDWQDPAPPPPPPNLSIEEVTGLENVPRSPGGGIVSMEDDAPPFPGFYPRRSPERGATEDPELEEQMVRAAIEASKMDPETGADSASQSVPGTEDDDIARAVSLSLKTAEDEKRFRDLLSQPEDTARGENPSTGPSSFPTRNVIQEPEETPDEQPLLRRRQRRVVPIVEEPAAEEAFERQPRSADEEHRPSAPQPNGDMIPADEWAGISSEEQDEAVMLEAAFFGGLPDIQYRPTPEFAAASAADVSSSRPQQPLSPSVVAQRLLREQQDDEYLASLAADREKEVKAKQDAEAASEMEKLRRQEEQRRSEAAAELERKLATKAESLPAEPTQEDDQAVTILVRLPDGSRHGRRFRKSDKLQNLFDFIDLSRAVEPGTYRLVRQYPRRAFTGDDHAASFDSLGLTSKQEALFLETI
ncbi:plant UBX domain-containing protein 8-like [Selaginella moellendorffii]|uniref:plant UBX domain-containing protein 8-like n=1 Tax=Selaginella moellendorffii TaxID=88036 RepID=UPI000D1C4098|nr:plant UBX domain-containing protein 8-like [Selaginella moellendorffii]|eukprot:XP_024515464.1 plant UBX domain-containing protein 8-like [Selaginella moellendorffii]